MNETELENYLQSFREKWARLEQQAERDRAADVAPDVDYLLFTVCNEEFALPMISVRATVSLPPCTPVPFAPAHHKGLANVRGQLVSVIDLRQAMGGELLSTPETALVVAECGPDDVVGFIVDSVNRVLSVKTESELQPVERLDVERYFKGALS